MNVGQTDPEETIVQLEPGLDISEDRCQVNYLVTQYMCVGLTIKYTLSPLTFFDYLSPRLSQLR